MDQMNVVFKKDKRINIYGKKILKKKRVYSVSKFPMGNVFHFPVTLYFERETKRSFVTSDTTLSG